MSDSFLEEYEKTQMEIQRRINEVMSEIENKINEINRKVDLTPPAPKPQPVAEPIPVVVPKKSRAKPKPVEEPEYNFDEIEHDHSHEWADDGFPNKRQKLDTQEHVEFKEFDSVDEKNEDEE